MSLTREGITQSHSILLSVAVLLSTAGMAAAQGDPELIWSTNPNLPTSFHDQYAVGPSTTGPAVNAEVADDFNVIGTGQWFHSGAVIIRGISPALIHET